MPLQLDRMQELDEALAAGALLLMPNYRSSDQLVELLCRHRLQQGKGPVFERPAIRAIDLWLADLWRELALLHDDDTLEWQVLQPAEEQLLWQQVITDTSPELLLLNREGSAAAASQAWRLLQQWGIPLQSLREHLTPAATAGDRDDREYAYDWLQAFSRHCRQQRLLVFSDMLLHLLRFVRDGTLQRLNLLPARLLLSGFDQPPPLYRDLFAALEAQQVPVTRWVFSAGRPESSLVSCREPAEECRAAAGWAQAVLEQDPQACIGIVTADSTTLKGSLERAFAQTFGARPGVYGNTVPGSLGDTPFVHTALACLDLFREDIDTLTCCGLLRSPWLQAAAEEADARAALELRLRRSQALRVRCAELRTRCLEEQRTWHCPQLGAALRDLRQHLLAQPRRQPLAGWLAFFERCWERLLSRQALFDSGDRTVVHAWELLQEQLQSGSRLYGTPDFSGACALLSQLVRTTTLGTGRQQTPILLLTPVMAAGLRFTHLWCLQMTEEFWPGEQLPHPYLPLALQRQHGLPGTDRQQMLHDARQLLAGLVDSTSTELVFSYADSADDLPQRRTALLPDDLSLRESEAETLPGALHPALAVFGMDACERLRESTTVAFPDELPVEGGAGVLTSQSSCPFKAFAQYRLQARELLRPTYGVPPRELGECVHAALQDFWCAMRDQAALLASSDADTAAILREALQQALKRLAALYPDWLTPRLLALELERLVTLLQGWLVQERLRGPFAVVATEQELFWTLDRLQLRLRVDRIDRHQDGSSVIVDYKTGRLATQRWEDPRPVAPQLPLYALALDHKGQDQTEQLAPATALLYARIQVDRLEWAGVAADAAVCPNAVTPGHKSLAAPDWDSLKRGWETVLGNLAAEFLQGYAAVQPTRRDSCAHCHLGSLCRIDELGERHDAGEEETDAGR